MDTHILTAETVAGCEFRLSPDVAVVVMQDGSARVLDMADRFYAIPRSAAMILQGVLEDGLDAATRRLADAFRLDEQRARADVEQFVQQLTSRGILLRAGEPVSRPKSFAAGVLARVMKAVFLLPTLGLKAAALLTVARVSCALCGWTATVEAWKRRFPPARADVLHDRDRARVAEIESAVARRAARHILGMECKERSLTCWALTRAVGLPAAMIIGADFYPLAGHVWCEAGARIISDDPQHCRRYQRLLCYA
jgi:hypothetical protein